MKNFCISILSVLAVAIFLASPEVSAQGNTGLKNPVTIKDTDNPFAQSRGNRTAENVQNPVFRACMIGDAFTLKQLVIQGKDVNVVDEDGNTALHYAAMFIATEGRAHKRHLVAPREVVSDLINDHKLDVNAVNKYGYTAMHIAGVVDEAGLLENIVKLNTPTLKKKYSEGKVSFKTTAKNGMTILHAAALNSVPREFSFVQKACPELLKVKDSRGNTPLHYIAICSRHDALDKDTVCSLSDINATNNNGETPLICLAKYGELELLAPAFIKHNADYTIKDKAGKTALDYAKERNKSQIIATITDIERSKSNEISAEKLEPIKSAGKYEIIYRGNSTDEKDILAYYKGGYFYEDKELTKVLYHHPGNMVGKGEKATAQNAVYRLMGGQIYKGYSINAADCVASIVETRTFKGNIQIAQIFTGWAKERDVVTETPKPGLNIKKKFAVQKFGSFTPSDIPVIYTVIGNRIYKGESSDDANCVLTFTGEFNGARLLFMAVELTK